MAIFTYVNPSVTIGSTDLSSYVTKVTVEYKVDQVESTASGDLAHKYVGGLQNNTITIDFNQDFAATKIDATLFPLVGTQVNTIKVVPTASAVSATNPSFTVSNSYLSGYAPVNMGAVGDLASVEAVFNGGTLVKATS